MIGPLALGCEACSAYGVKEGRVNCSREVCSEQVETKMNFECGVRVHEGKDRGREDPHHSGVRTCV